MTEYDNCTGYEQAKRGPSSTLRYRPTNVVEANNPIARRTTAQKGAPMQARTTTSPHNRTTEDVIVRPVVRPMINRRNMLLGLSGVAFTAATLITGQQYAQARIDQYQHQMLEGVRPATTCGLVCGHGDSASNPTELHAFVTSNKINFIELPGGNASKAKIFQSFPFPSYGYNGDPSRVFLEILPEQLASGKYQIILRATGEDVPLFAEKVLIQLPLVDAGDHFAPPSK